MRDCRPFETKVSEAMKAEGMDVLASVDLRAIRLINRMARDDDEPGSSAADRAIRWWSRVYFPANGPVSAYEYAAGLSATMDDIVNGRHGT